VDVVSDDLALPKLLPGCVIDLSRESGEVTRHRALSAALAC
jgi:hypothetical protein